MAKKQDKLTFMQMPLPQGQNSYKLTKVNWQGLNKAQTIDTGVLSAESNISTDDAPYLTPSQKRISVGNGYFYPKYPISMFAFDDFYVVVYRESTAIKMDYVTSTATYTGTLRAAGVIGTMTANITDYSATVTGAVKVTNTAHGLVTGDNITITYTTNYNNSYDITRIDADNFYIKAPYIGTGELIGAWVLTDLPRTIVKFNVYTYPTGQEGNVLAGSYTKKLLIFPDKKSIDFTISANFTPDSMTNVPTLKYATVYNSRVFGVDNDRVYASGFNDYTNWTLDTSLVSSANNAWVSPAQGNTKANGSFTGITTFDNHVVCFKHDYMHQINNNKNPFRIQDIYAEGAIDNRSIQNVDGNLIFVSADNVKMYTGGNPRIIGLDLNIDKYTKAVSGTDNIKYYLYCRDSIGAHRLFVYDTRFRQWAEEFINFEILSFAFNNNGMYCLAKEGMLYKIDSGIYTNQFWYCETDLYIGKSIDIKHISKIQLLADIAANSTLYIYCLYDDEEFNVNTTQQVYAYTNTSGSSKRQPIRIIPRQTASYGFKLRISGIGYSKLYQLELFLRQGGELYV